MWTQCGFHMDTMWFLCGHHMVSMWLIFHHFYIISVANRSQKIANLWKPVTSLIMVWFSIREKFWKALGLLYQSVVSISQLSWDFSMKQDVQENSWCLWCLWKNANLWKPVTSLILVQFSIRKKFWKALGLLYQPVVSISQMSWDFGMKQDVQKSSWCLKDTTLWCL